MQYFIRDDVNSFERGENHYKSGHVLECSVSEGQLVGCVQASMKVKDKTYRVKVSFADRELTFTNRSL